MADNKLTIDMDALSIQQIAATMTTAMINKGKRDTKDTLMHILNHKHGGSDEVIKEAARMLVRGADDQWSGRENDLKRAYTDGQRRIAGKVVEESLLYGEPVTAKMLDTIF